MPLAQLIGWRGSGKTWFVLKFILNLLEIINDIPIYSNFKIKNKNYNKLELHTLLSLPIEIILAMDEVYNIINARLSMSYINIYAGHIAFQLRKTATLIFITMTQLRTVDVLYRDEWDYRIYCERLQNEYEDWRLWDFIFEIHDKRKEKFTTWIVEYKTAEKIFDMYDTYEIIKPRYQSRIEYEFLISDPETLALRSLDIAKKIKPKIKAITKDEIEWALKRTGFDKCWKNDVYIELKHELLIKNLNT